MTKELKNQKVYVFVENDLDSGDAEVVVFTSMQDALQKFNQRFSELRQDFSSYRDLREQKKWSYPMVQFSDEDEDNFVLERYLEIQTQEIK